VDTAGPQPGGGGGRGGEDNFDEISVCYQKDMPERMSEYMSEPWQTGMTVFWSRWVSLEVKYLFPIKFMKLKIVISAPTWLNCACAAHVSHNGNGPVFLLADFSTWGDADPHCHPPCRPAALKGAIQSVAPRWIRAC